MNQKINNNYKHKPFVMIACSTPVPNPYLQRYGGTKTLITGISIGKRMQQYFSFLPVFSLLFALVFSSHANGQTSGYTCNSCNANDVSVLDIALVSTTPNPAYDAVTNPNVNKYLPLGTTCTSGSAQQGYLQIHLDQNATTRYGIYVTGDIYVDDELQGSFASCDGSDFVKGTKDYFYYDASAISWTCGTKLQLKNVFVGWGNAAGDDICNHLCDIGPHCNKDIVKTTFTVITPLSANFTYSGSCPAGNSAQRISFNALGSGGTTGGTPNPGYVSYSWEIRDQANNLVTTLSGSNPSYDFTTAGNYSVTLTVTDDDPAASSSKTNTVTVVSCCSSPSISDEPDDVSVCTGQASSFTAAASGGNPTPTVKWQYRANSGASWADVVNSFPYSNAGTTTLNIADVTGLDGYQYRAVFTSGTCSSAESVAATLTVSQGTVAGTLGSAQTVCSGNQPASGLSLTGNTGDVVKWQKSTDNFVSNSTDIANTSTALSAAAIGSLTQDTWFRAVVKSGVCDAANTNAVKITVNATTVAGTVGSTQTVCSGNQPASGLSLTGNTGDVVKWQKSTDNFVSNSTDIANTTTTLSAASIGVLTQDTWFRAVVKSGVCDAANTNAVKITVNATTVAGTVGSAQTVCSGNQPASGLSLTGNTGDVVKWQKSTDNFVSNSTDIANTTTALSAAAIGALTQDTWFRAVVKNGVCDAANTSAVKITVNATTVAGTVGSAQTICSGNQPASGLSLTGNTGDVVKWQKSTDNFVSNSMDIANTTTSLSAAAIGSLTQDTWFRAVVKSGVCDAANTNAVKITVNATTVAGTVGSAQTICSGNQPLFGLSLTGNTGDVVKWQKSTDNFVSNWTDIANTTTTLSAAAIGSLTQDTWFRAVIKNGVCDAANTNAVKITVQRYVLCAGYYGDYFANTGLTTAGGQSTVTLVYNITADQSAICNTLVGLSASDFAIDYTKDANVESVSEVVGTKSYSNGVFSVKYTIKLKSTEYSGTVLFTLGTTNSSKFAISTGSCTDNPLVTTSSKADGFVTGGGFIIPTNAGGTIGTSGINGYGLKNNFGFNIKFNKAGKLQGNWNTIIRRNEGGVVMNYQVKSNVASTLVVSQDPSSKKYRADLTYTSANFQNLTCSTCTVNANNGTVTVTVWDIGEPGAGTDSILISIRDKNNVLWYTSNMPGSHNSFNADVALIKQGNIQIHILGAAGGSTTKEVQTTTTVLNQAFELKATPNPTHSYFVVQLPNLINRTTKLRVIDVLGRVIEVKQNLAAGQTLRIGSNYNPGVYIIEVTQGDVVKQIKLVKQ